MDFFDDCQLILPTDKRNPSFSLYLTADKNSIHVLYGFELFEVVPNDPEHMVFKMMVGRLYNACVKTTTLEEVFDLDRKTIRSWGLAILSRDPSHLARVMLGRSVNQKRTPNIDRYVLRRRRELLNAGCTNYRATVLAEIHTIFEVSLCGETIRQIVAQSKEDMETPERSDETSEDGLEKTEESICSGTTAPAPRTENPPESQTQSSEVDFCDAELPSPSKYSPPNWQPELGETILCDHVGVLIFAGALSTIAQATTPPEPLLAQWLASILLGAVNIEQTKYLNWDDLGHLLENPLRAPTPQREQLTRLASPSTIDSLLRWNWQQLGGEDNNENNSICDLYYDPHTAHYTGAQNVLKGWCAAIRWADRLVNSDYIHTAQGQPIYFECTDNYDDLRSRFFPMVQRLRSSLQWGEERILTFIVDRAIFGNEVFNQVLAAPSIHLITWEKDYQADPKEDWALLTAKHQLDKTYGRHTLTRLRNNARDHRFYRFEYISRPWGKNPNLRQIIVRATNPSGKTVQLSILSSDKHRSMASIVHRIFNRWVQENDFKYLNKHFGINQLTSYRSTPYAQLREQLIDRQVPNQAYVEKVKIGRQLAQKKSRQLLIADQAQRVENQRQQVIAILESQIAKRAVQSPDESQKSQHEQTTTAERKIITRHRNASKRQEKYREERVRKIEAIQEEIVLNQAEKELLAKEVSRVEQLIQQEMVRMDLSNKTLMDTIKITARNIFYRLFAPFKVAYDNYRDDHDYYRELTQSGGVLRWTGSVVEVHIVPQVNHPPKLQKIIETHLEQLNASGLTMPDGSGRALRLHLTSKEQISVRIKEFSKN